MSVESAGLSAMGRGMYWVDVIIESASRKENTVCRSAGDTAVEEILIPGGMKASIDFNVYSTFRCGTKFSDRRLQSPSIYVSLKYIRILPTMSAPSRFLPGISPVVSLTL